MLKKKYRFVIVAVALAVLSACDGSGNTATAPTMSEISSSSVYATPASSLSSYEAADDLVRSTSSTSSLNAPSISYGSLVDLRDGRIYKTVDIGTQTWMAQNLNYETEKSYCYDNKHSNCTTYGRLYTWAAATTACPTGWHLPSTDEWETLFAAVGGRSNVGKVLRSQTMDWASGSGFANEDAYGFAALPAGYSYSNSINYLDFLYAGEDAYFWSATEYDGNFAYSMHLRYYDDVNEVLDYDGKYHGFSVRCLQDYSSNTLPSSSTSIAYGSLVDTRDGQVYKTVNIGSQTWMAQNINYVTDDSYCYDDNYSICTEYGRLYTWTAALTACPTGWHLPSKDEWETLFDAVGGPRDAGKVLKSQTGWYSGGNGTDAYGFAVLPAGYRFQSGYFYGTGYYAYFWSATEYDSGYAGMYLVDYTNDDAGLVGDLTSRGFSVRCLKD